VSDDAPTDAALPAAGRSFPLRRHHLPYFPDLQVGEEVFAARFAADADSSRCSAHCCRAGVLIDIAHRDRILAEAREHAAALAQHTEVVRVAEEQAARLRSEAEADAAALRRETDEFIDSRMAGFESVLHKTASQVRTARSRLAERSGLNSGDGRTD